MPRYVVADPERGSGWSHIFTETDPDSGARVERERMTRFVYDAEAGALVHLDVYRPGPAAADGAETADVEDSLKNANAEALENPEAWGLIGSDAPPDWCAIPRPAATL